MSNQNSAIEVVPAVLPKSFEDLRAALSLVQGVAPVVQVDIVDGVFAPNTTWPYRDAPSFQEILSGDAGMPFWDEFDFEFDLMVGDPQQVVSDYVQAGAARLVIHGIGEGSLKALELLQSQRLTPDLGVLVGIALPPSADVSELEPLEGQFDYLQVMGIEKVGFQHQPFSDKALIQITELREKYPGTPIQVDGGVNFDTIEALVRAGATRLIVGSAIFSSDDPQGAYRNLTKKAQKYR